MREIKEEKGNELLINIFDDITDIYTWLKKTPRRKGASNGSESNSYSFTGTHSYEEAMELMRYGDEKTYKKIEEQNLKLDVKDLLGKYMSRKFQRNNIVGQVPNVPNFLANNPLSMIDFQKKETNQKVLNLVLTFTGNCGISSESLQETGILYVNTIDILEKIGYRCNLYLTFPVDAGMGGDRIYFLIKVKNDKEPLNIKKMAFLLANTSMFRRIGFAWIERCNYHNGEITKRSYGRTFENETTITSDLKKYIKEDFIIWRYQNNGNSSVEDVLEELKQKGVKIDL